MEVETPMLVANAGGAAARPFETHYNALNEDVKLRISLELYLKRLIVGGLERVYEIGRVFRNEGVDTRHNPEFTLMELYQAYTDYDGMMDLTENMYPLSCRESMLELQDSHTTESRSILAKPFERITMIDAVKKYAGVDFNEVKTDEEARELADEHHVEYEERHKKGDILNLFFEEFCRREADPANIHYGSSDRDFTTYKEETRRSRLCRAFRVLYERMGNVKCILRAE